LEVPLDALLAFPIGRDQRAVHVNASLCEEVVGLLGPDLPPRDIDGILQRREGLAIKAPAEVARRGGIRNALGAEESEVGLILAAEFEVFEASAGAGR
jgi:hypothetical protein